MVARFTLQELMEGSVCSANEATGCSSGKRVFITHHHSTTEAAACSHSHPVTKEPLPPKSHILRVSYKHLEALQSPKCSLAHLGLNPAHVVISGFSFLHPAI